MKQLHTLVLELLWLAPYKLQKGIGFSLGGDKSDSSSKESETERSRATQRTRRKEEQDTLTRTKKKEASTREAKQKEESEQTLTTLDSGTRRLIKDLLQDTADAETGELVSTITERALGADDAFAGLVDPIVANARANLENDLGQQLQNLARAAGSSQNSLVAQLGLDEAANVEREIASLAATLGIQTRQAATAEQQGALESTQNFTAQLAEVLKGAKQVGSSSTSSRAVEDLISLITGRQRERASSDVFQRETGRSRGTKNVSGSEDSSSSSLGIDIGI